MASESETMLPCPCGRPARISAPTSSGLRVIACDDIECRWKIKGYVRDSLIESWNRRAPSAEAKDAELLPDRLDRLADELVAADTAYDSFMSGLASSIKGRAIVLRMVHGPTGKPPAIAQQHKDGQEVGRG